MSQDAGPPQAGGVGEFAWQEVPPGGRIKVWLDDVREAPSGYVRCHSVNETIALILECERRAVGIAELNLDHDLGDFAGDGGDAICLLDFLVERQTFYPIVLHTANPVGRANMQRAITRHWPPESNSR